MIQCSILTFSFDSPINFPMPVYQGMVLFSGHFFHIFEIINFCFVVAICDLVHDVKAIFHSP